MSKQDNVIELAKMVSHIKESIRRAEEFAKKHELDFNIDIAYGMGGEFNGGAGCWNPSSQSC